jgi:hypothetical protein
MSPKVGIPPRIPIPPDSSRDTPFTTSELRIGAGGQESNRVQIVIEP